MDSILEFFATTLESRKLMLHHFLEKETGSFGSVLHTTSLTCLPSWATAIWETADS